MPSPRLYAIFLSLSAAACIAGAEDKITWEINTLSSIGGNPTTVNGTPALIETPQGKAVRFNGSPDQLLVSNNPLDTATTFTIELLLNPYDIGSATALKEPRVLHVQDSVDKNRRITMELRISGAKWYIDAYICSENSKKTLVGKPIHDVGKWHNYTITYSNKMFKAYVNGVTDDSGDVEYRPIPKSGKVSLGCRMTKEDYFKGAIRRVIFTKRLLTPGQFDTSYKETTPVRAVALLPVRRNVTRPAPLIVIAASRSAISLFTLSGKKSLRVTFADRLAGGLYIQLPAGPSR